MLFLDPVTREVKGHLSDTDLSSLKGITEQIYWKPTIQYYVDAVRYYNLFKLKLREL